MCDTSPSPLKWRRVGGSCRVNTTGTHANNGDKVLTAAINLWISNQADSQPLIADISTWMNAHVYYSTTLQYPTLTTDDDVSMGSHRGHRDHHHITQHMMNSYDQIMEYCEWWIGHLACYGKCLTFSGDLAAECHLTKLVLTHYITSAKAQHGWYHFYRQASYPWLQYWKPQYQGCMCLWQDSLGCTCRRHREDLDQDPDTSVPLSVGIGHVVDPSTTPRRSRQPQKLHKAGKGR